MTEPNGTEPTAVLRSAYLPYAFRVEEVDLRFELDPKATRVCSRLVLKRDPAQPDGKLVLDGEGPVSYTHLRAHET